VTPLAIQMMSPTLLGLSPPILNRPAIYPLGMQNRYLVQTSRMNNSSRKLSMPRRPVSVMVFHPQQTVCWGWQTVTSSRHHESQPTDAESSRLVFARDSKPLPPLDIHESQSSDTGSSRLISAGMAKSYLLSTFTNRKPPIPSRLVRSVFSQRSLRESYIFAFRCLHKFLVTFVTIGISGHSLIYWAGHKNNCVEMLWT
jgi:hypothetical protein